MLAPLTFALAALSGVPAQTTASDARERSCRIDGRVTSRGEAIPGATIVLRVDDSVAAVTSTGADGSFSVSAPAAPVYRMTINLTGFLSSERTVTVGQGPCPITADALLEVRRRPSTSVSAPTRALGERPTAEAPRGSTASRPRPTGFQQVGVQTDAIGEAALGAAPINDAAEVTRWHRHEPGSRADDRSRTGHRARSARSEHGPVCTRLRPANWNNSWSRYCRRRAIRRRWAGWRSRRRRVSSTGRPRWLFPRRPRQEPITGRRQLHVWRVGAQFSAVSSQSYVAKHTAELHSK
jgi:Carboxypeptidase regulatory-like domain